MSETPKKLYGPAYLTNSAANLYVPSSSIIYGLVGHIRLCNTDTAGIAVTLYVGATGGSAGGTEILPTVTVAANSVLDVYFPAGLKLLSTQFLTGLAATTNKVTITIMGGEGVV